MTDDFERALEPVSRRMERVKLPAAFLAELLREGRDVHLGEAAMRWAGMPNKNERAALTEALDALAAAGFFGASGKGNMEGRAVLGVVFVSACALGLCVARAATTQQSGQYALARGSAHIVSRITLDRNGDLSVKQYANGARTPLAACGSPKSHSPCYELSEGQPVHVVLVRDDFGAFSHVHPQAQGDAYTVHLGLEPRRRYYAFVSSKIRSMPEQAFRFVLQSSSAPSHATTTLRPIRHTSVGPYDVSLDQITAKAARGAVLNADIVRRPHTSGVSPFHVAWVQAVLVNTATLTFAHIDGASDRGLCCEYALRSPPLSKGLYKLWLQFDDGTATYTAPLTFAAQ